MKMKLSFPSCWLMPNVSACRMKPVTPPPGKCWHGVHVTWNVVLPLAGGFPDDLHG
jgi:hypothetical protein